jgi:ubiquinol-cytochrome c reductase cytochrome b subunit
MIGFFLMIGTGLLLAQIYNPAPDQSYQSLQTIQKIGWTSYLRAFHYWTAQGIILALLAHLSRVFITGAYQYPRQVTWWVGVTLLAIMLMGSYFSGTVLKWDEEGFDALAHYQEALRALGPIGAALTESLTGSPPMNFRIYVSHIAAFPILITLLIVVHSYLIHSLNLSPTPKDKWADQPEIPVEEMKERFSTHVVDVIIFAILYYGWIAALAFFIRAPLAGPPNPEHGALKPPWPFLWMYGFENRWGIVSTVFASSTLFGILALIPLLDRKRDRRFRARVGILTLGGIVACSLVGLTLHGYLTPAQMHAHTHGTEHHSHSEQSDHHDSPSAKPHSHKNDDSKAKGEQDHVHSEEEEHH